MTADAVLGCRIQRRHRPLLTRLAILLVLAGLLELAPRLGLVSRLVLVPVSSMLAALWHMLHDPNAWFDLGVTALRVLVSFIAAIVVGLIAGYGLWRRPWAYRLLAPYMASYYAMPVFAFYPVFISLFGLSSLPMILMAFAYAVIAVIDSTVTGFRNIPIAFHRTVRMYRLPWQEATWKVYIPSVAGTVFGGLRLAASYSLIGVVASEFLLSPDGLGRRVSSDFQNFELEAMYATILLLLLFEIAVLTALGTVERRVALHPGLR